MKPLRYVLIGDGQSPHLAKWAHALMPHVELWVVSSRGFRPDLDDLLPPSRKLSLTPESGAPPTSIRLLLSLPRLARWLREIDPDWINPHYLTSHGTIALLAKVLFHVPGHILGSAWGSDILVTPQRHVIFRWLTRQILKNCQLTTSDSIYMAEQMRLLGAGEVITFPFGLEQLPEASQEKEPWLFFANRGLEPLYQPLRVLEYFADIAAQIPQALLVIANDGSMRSTLEAKVRADGLTEKVHFTGRLDSRDQNRWYDRAQWYLSLPASDSVSVSVLEAMAHGCIPLLSDLPANRELVLDGKNGLIVNPNTLLSSTFLESIRQRNTEIAHTNRTWIETHGLFTPSIESLVARLAASR